MSYFSISSLANSLLLSILVAESVWPNIFSPAALNSSTIPAAKAASGPTTVRSTSFSRANFFSAATSVSEIGTHSACAAIPAFPGAHHIFSTCSERLSASTIAWQRPPPPTTRTFFFILRFVFIFLYSGPGPGLAVPRRGFALRAHPAADAAPAIGRGWPDPS